MQDYCYIVRRLYSVARDSTDREEFAQCLEDYQLYLFQCETGEDAAGSSDWILKVALPHTDAGKVKFKLRIENSTLDPEPLLRLRPHIVRSLEQVLTNQYRLLQLSMLLELLDTLGCYIVVRTTAGSIFFSTLSAQSDPQQLILIDRLRLSSAPTTQDYCVEIYRDRESDIRLSESAWPTQIHLTPKERAIIEAMINNQSFKQYAARHAVSESTVRTQSKALFRKMEVSSQVQLINHIFQNHLLPTLAVK